MPKARREMLVLCLIGICGAPTRAEEFWVVPKGQAELSFDRVALARLGLSIPSLPEFEGARLRQTFGLDRNTDLAFVVENRRVTKLLLDRLSILEGLRMVSGTGEFTVFDLVVDAPDGALPADVTPTPDTIDRDATLLLGGVRAALTESTGDFRLPATDLIISEGLARALGDTRLGGQRIGSVLIQGQAVWVAGDRIPFVRTVKRSTDTASSSAAAPQGPDVTLCQLFDLQQWGRVGSVVGLAVSTTSWNLGTKDARWFAVPQVTHPFIAQNLFRLKDDQFEQIGQSWVKHAFFALGDEQCGTACTFEPGHNLGNWLGVGCTDTYSSFLNGSQSLLGPRFEINPWTGAWTLAGSHMDPNTNPPPHTAISHRLQVQDDDLDAVLNAGAQYVVEGYYVVGDDVIHTNNAVWKPVSVSGSAGGTWSFPMSGSSTPPNTGFAIDAWTGAQQTILAQEVPVRVGQSPDGRCILGAKATDLGGGTWRYEYALYNVDMDRKVDSFRIPIHTGTNVTDIAFHAAVHHDEPFSNNAWTSTVEPDAVVWSTPDNPLRWGTLDNFRFTADVAPFDTTVTLGLFEPGTPTTVSGITTGPDSRTLTCEVPAGGAVALDPGTPVNRYVAIQGDNPGEQTAIRVTLNALLQGQGASAFNGEVRWLGPPAVHSAGPGAVPPTFMASELRCTPFFTDWSAVGPVHVFGTAILPNSNYGIQVLHKACEAQLGDESKYSPAVLVDTALWGDIVAPFGVWNAPGAQPNFADISAVVGAFIGGPLAVPKTRAQLQPNLPQPDQDISFADINADVGAFQGSAFPFAGPSSCP